MRLDSKLSALLSDFFLDIAKAAFVATFIAPPLVGIPPPEYLILLTKGLANVIVFLGFAWYLAKSSKEL